MGRNGYRDGMAQVNIVLDPELRDRMKRKAQRNGRSLSEEFRRAALDWLGEVEDDERGTAPGLRLAASADGGGPRPVPGGGRSDDAGVDAGPVAVPVARIDRHGIGAGVDFDDFGVPLRSAVNVPLPVDEFADDYRAAERDPRGRLLSPIVRDEWIDTA